MDRWLYILLVVSTLLLLAACRSSGAATQIEPGQDVSELQPLPLPAEPSMLPPLVELTSGLPRHATAVTQITAVALPGGGFTAFARVALSTPTDMRWHNTLIADPEDPQRLMRWNGSIWTTVDDPLLQAGSTRFTIDRQHGWLYANGYNDEQAANGSFLRRSSDGGINWTSLDGWTDQVHALARAIVPTADGSIVADTGDGRIVISHDEGATWIDITMPLIDDATRMARFELIGAGPSSADTIEEAAEAFFDPFYQQVMLQ